MCECVSGGGGRKGMDDDIHFRDEEREKKKAGMEGCREGGNARAVAAETKGEKKKLLRLAPIKPGGGGRRVFFFFLFSLTPGSSGDRRLCTRVCVCVSACAHTVAGLIRQRFPGTQEDVGEGPRGS